MCGRYACSLERVVKDKMPLDLGKVSRWAVGIARGLEVLHSHAIRVIHADLEPGNIFIIDDGQQQEAVIGDLGVALRIDQASRLPNMDKLPPYLRSLTRASNAPETRKVLEAAAPWQWVGDELLDSLQDTVYQSMVTAAADVWAWGYCLLCLVMQKKELKCSEVDSLAESTEEVSQAAPGIVLT